MITTTMELKSLKMDLVEELLSLNDKEMLNRVKTYLKRLKRMEAEKEEDEISKEEILAGIDAGLKDVKAGRTRSAYELINEL